MNPEGVQKNNDESVVKLEEILDLLSYDESLNYLYDEDSKERVQEALISMGFESLISTFEVEKVDYPVFSNMDASLIYGILKRFPWGIRKKFLMEYETWLKNEIGQKNFESYSAGNTKKVNDQTLPLILNEDAEAKQFFVEHSEDKAPLSIAEKRRLVGIIINYFVERKVTLSKKDVQMLSKGIENVFHGESAEEYCNDKSGLLYNKSKNMITKYRKLGALEAPIKKKLKPDKSMKEDQGFTGTEIDADSFIKSNAMQPLKDIISPWEISFKVRRHNIICNKSGIKEICEQYKSFVRNDGWILINSDFDKIYPGSNFLHNWTEMKGNLMEILKSNITNTAIKEILLNADQEDSDSNSIAIIKGIHAFLYSAGTRNVPSGSKNRKVKDTIQDSIKTMVLQCSNEASLNTELLNVRDSYEAKGNSFQPVIIGFDQHVTNKEKYFLVYFDDNYYRFEIFDKALEVLLKMYYVLDLKFPTSSQSVYSFLSAVFLKIETDITPKVKSLINLLKSKM